MKRFLLLFLVFAGCKTWDVRAFDIPLNGKEPRYVAASSELSSEEKWGVIVIVAVAVGATIAIAAASN